MNEKDYNEKTVIWTMIKDIIVKLNEMEDRILLLETREHRPKLLGGDDGDSTQLSTQICERYL